MKVVDTIAAIATASGNSGIGIIRVSGDEAIEIVDKIFKSVNSDKKLVNVKSHTINYGHIVDNDKVIDEVLVSVMNGPHSYTGEDVVEIINLRGETTTVYKLVDGRYMDCTNTVYIYDRKDTWTDTNGVEWNQEVI